MKSTKPTPAAPLQPQIPALATELLRGTAPLKVALAAWRARHDLRLSDVSAMIGRQSSAVSAMLHNPTRCPGTRAAVARLIGYEETAPLAGPDEER